MSFTGFISGLQYETIEAMKAGEKEYVQRQIAQQTPDPFYDPNAPSAEAILEAARFVENAGQDRARQVSDERAAQVWLELHPEYTPSPRNAALLEYALRSKGILNDAYVTVEDLDSVYDDLRSRGLIEANPSKLAEQHRAEVISQAEEIRQARRSRPSSGISTRTISRSTRKEYSEDDLASMPLDQLRALAMKEAGADGDWN